MSRPDDSLVEVGIIVDAHGIRGEVKIKSHLNPPRGIFDLKLTDATGEKTFCITSNKGSDEKLIALIEGITDRNQAELLKGRKLYAPRDMAGGQTLSDNIIGLPARLENGDVYGEVTGLFDFGAGGVIEIRKAHGESEMFPLRDAFAEIKDDHVLVHPPEYLEAK